MKWEHKAAVVGATVIGCTLWIAFAVTDHQERVAENEKQVRLQGIRDEAERARAKQQEQLRGEFPAARQALVASLRNMSPNASLASAIRDGERFAGVADAEFVALVNDAKARAAQRAQAEADRVAADKAKADARVQSAMVYAKLIKRSAHDPSSVDFESVIIIDGSDAICYRFRARNAFNALRRGTFLVTAKGAPMAEGSAGFAGAWNRDCAGKSGSDVSAAANAYT